MGETYSLTEFERRASEFAKKLAPLPHRATVAGLYGDLGAGKTTFVQAAAKALGVTETVNSPTFLILKSYQLTAPTRTGRNSDQSVWTNSYKLLHHIDAYRIKHSDELRKLGFADLLADPQNLIFVEWAVRVTDILPHDHIQLRFEFVDRNMRRIISQHFLSHSVS